MSEHKKNTSLVIVVFNLTRSLGYAINISHMASAVLQTVPINTSKCSRL